MKKTIAQLNPYYKSIAELSIQLTDFCNFSCKYCITGKKFSGESIDINSFNKIEKLVLKLKEKFENVKITITGGEPSLAKDFFHYLNSLLDLNIIVKVNTNSFILNDKQGFLEELSKNKNIEKLCLNITFHYKQYLGKQDIFIKSLKNLDKFNIKYGINFLLPDDEKIENFKKIQKEILSQIKVKSYNYSLIKSSNGKISENYSKQMLDFFDKNFNDQEKIKNIEVIYKENGKKVISSSELLYKGLNNFSGYKCIYLNREYLNIYVETDLSCHFGVCYTLNRLHYSIDEVINMLDSSPEKSIICGDHSCICESDFYTPKIYIKKKSIIEDKLKGLIKKVKPIDFELDDIIIGGNSIQIILSKNEVLVFIIVEKIIDKTIKYSFFDTNLGFQYYIRNKDNEFISINHENQLEINKFIGKIFLLKEVFEKIINKNNI